MQSLTSVTIRNELTKDMVFYTKKILLGKTTKLT
jgi:hypothetical protein